MLGRPIPTKHALTPSQRAGGGDAHHLVGFVVAHSALQPGVELLAVLGDRVPGPVGVRCRGRSSPARRTAWRRRARARRAVTTQRGRTTPLGRGSSSSTISSTVTRLRLAPSTVSFCTPTWPHSWTLPLPVGLLGVDDPDVEVERGDRGQLLAGERAGDRLDRVRVLGQRRAVVAAHDREREVARRRHVAVRHARVAVLLDLELVRSRRPRGSGAASRRPGCRPRRRSACARSRRRSAGRRRCPGSSAPASGRACAGG